MSVLIKGMKMPENCFDCRFHKLLYCTLTDICTSTAQGCPLVEIPPHGRLIDGDKLTGEQYKEGHLMVVEMDAIEDAPTVIEAEG